MAATTFLYFSYGSNMLTRRLTKRAPSAKKVGVGYVQGRRLTFDKVSKDGSGKCDAETTGIAADRVYGVLFEIALSDKPMLDKAEGLGHGYTKASVEVVTAASHVLAEAYIATEKELGLRPYGWYKAIVIAGAVEHGLPSDYVEWLMAFDSVEDPDVERRMKNETLLFVG